MTSWLEAASSGWWNWVVAVSWQVAILIMPIAVVDRCLLAVAGTQTCSRSGVGSRHARYAVIRLNSLRTAPVGGPLIVKRIAERQELGKIRRSHETDL